MVHQTRTLAIAAFFCVVYAGGRWVAATTKIPIEGDVNTSSIPMKIGKWTGRTCVENQKLSDQREGVVERIYQGPDELQAHIVVIYSRNWRGIHPPEMCLTAAGWRMEREYTSNVDVPNGPEGRARALIMGRQGRTLGGVYLYVGRNHVSDSWSGLFSRMVDSPQEVRSLVAVYAQDGAGRLTGEQLSNTACKFATTLLPYVQRSIRNTSSTDHLPSK